MFETHRHKHINSRSGITDATSPKSRPVHTHNRINSQDTAQQGSLTQSGYGHSQEAENAIQPEPFILEILVAEDNFANQLIAKTLLMRAGHHVTTVSNGQDAVQTSRIKAFDLILMDIEMPIMNGIEATESIRQEKGPNQNTQIIALTAYGSPSEKYTYKHSGIDYVLTKPFRMMDLAYILEHRHTLSVGISPPPPVQIEPHVPTAFLDTNTLSSLVQGAGVQGVRPVIKAYWRSAYALLSHIQDAHQSWDRDSLQKSAHALKGASINIGLIEVSRIAAQLQNARPDSVTEYLEMLELAMAQSRKALTHYLSDFDQRSA